MRGYDNWKLASPDCYESEPEYCQHCESNIADVDGTCPDCAEIMPLIHAKSELEDAVRYLEKAIDQGNSNPEKWIRHAQNSIAAAKRYFDTAAE